jgi:hypothetical protein
MSESFFHVFASALGSSTSRRALESEILFSPNYGASNVRQKRHKSNDFTFLYEMLPKHLGFYEVESQFSLRWFFQHALAWKGHVQKRKVTIAVGVIAVFRSMYGSNSSRRK